MNLIDWIQTMTPCRITFKAFEASKQTATAKHVDGHGTHMWCGSTTMASISRTWLPFDIAHPFLWPLVDINLSLSHATVFWTMLLLRIIRKVFEASMQMTMTKHADGHDTPMWWCGSTTIASALRTPFDIVKELLKEQGVAARPMAGLYPKDFAHDYRVTFFKDGLQWKIISWFF